MTGLLGTVVLLLLALPTDGFVLVKPQQEPKTRRPGGGVAATAAAPEQMKLWWYPKDATSGEFLKDISYSVKKHILEEQSAALAAALVKERLRQLDSTNTKPQDDPHDDDDIHPLAKERFRDLACTRSGERALESLFRTESLRHFVDSSSSSPSSVENVDDLVRGAVMCFQSLCIMGALMGMQGRPEQIQKRFAHLRPTPKQGGRVQASTSASESVSWSDDDINFLKREKDREPGTALLAALLRKRNPRGAYQLLVDLHAWTKYENLDLLRSGSRVRFNEQEERAAADLYNNNAVPMDLDDLMGLRQDLTHLKVYTIDDAKTAEIDDGVSVEALPDGKWRIWIHIADADRWAPKGSELFDAARRRITSIYLPEGDIPMFNANVGASVMSLRANQDSCALSLSVELNDDGSVIEDSIRVMPSTVRVAYRLTYDEVDEMFEEGSAYSEEKDLGVLLEIAKQRWQYRFNKGSIESRIPRQIPTKTVAISPHPQAPDGIMIVMKSDNSKSSDPETMSKARMVVTEAMILSGEALGRFADAIARTRSETIEEYSICNGFRVPYRTQEIDLKARDFEVKTNNALLEYNMGDGYCQAWHFRRFLNPVAISEDPAPHAGLGIDCYVQWSSPIRRFTDLQVHTAVKRYLRRAKACESFAQGKTLPPEIQWSDLGLPHGAIKEGKLMCRVPKEDLDNDINYLDGGGIVKVVRNVQNQTSNRWMNEYFQRIKEADPQRTFKAIVLGCPDPQKNQIAVFIDELGFEHRMTGHNGVSVGDTISVQIGRVAPEAGVLELHQV
jgi:exoribonuclease R